MLSRLSKVPSAAFSTSRAVLGSQDTVKLWIDGREVESKTNQWIELTNPVSFLKF